MSATFNVQVTGLRTTTVGSLTDVVKQVDVLLQGADSGQEFYLPATIDLTAPDPAKFVQFSTLTEAQVVAFVQASEAYANLTAHMQLVLNNLIEKAALTQKSPPWKPV